MKLAVVGFGNAGGKVTDRLLDYESSTDRALCRFTTVINTAKVDLEKIERVPPEYRVLIGQTHAQSKGHGAGADPDIGAEIAREDELEIGRVLDQVPLHEVDAFLIVAGLGGGTGSGGGPVLASMLQERYAEPVYGLGVLPSEDEGGRASLNAARSVRSYADATDALLLFDNNAWREGRDAVDAGYERTNLEIAKRVGTLLAAGATDGTTVAENAMDASDINRTLAVGGVSTVAYAETELEQETSRRQGLLGRFRSPDPEREADGADAATKVHGLVRRAVRSRLTCPANVDSTERALIVVSGPPAELSRKGLESARSWLEQQTNSIEVLAGDNPLKSADKLSAVVVLSNVTDVPRVDNLQDQAVDAADNIENQRETRDEEIEDLIRDDDGTLDPI